METAKIEGLARIGRSVTVKGEVSGSEDLYVDGQVEGSIDLQANKLTVGPNGQVRANVNAKSFHFLLQFTRRRLAVIGEEKIFFLLRFEPRDEFRRAINQLVAVINHAVHVNDEPGFTTDLVERVHIIPIRLCRAVCS